jgi:lipopolysaccharide/colanic/teichoic acid biosynthesis glycosyltransferase
MARARPLTRRWRDQMSVEVIASEADLWYHGTKRALDLALAGVALVALSPILLAIAVAVYLDNPRASILYRQRRTGKGGRVFELLKFRTMVGNADELKEQLRSRSSVAWPDFRLDDDPRVTRVGRWLRSTSLDELPQLVNVLRGEMTLVGPRPTSFSADTYRTWQSGRLDYRPGITGPWQVDGRTTLDFDGRCRLEIAFFRHPSMRRELWLLVRTVGVVFRRTGVA